MISKLSLSVRKIMFQSFTKWVVIQWNDSLIWNAISSRLLCLAIPYKGYWNLIKIYFIPSEAKNKTLKEVVNRYLSLLNV